MRASKEAEDDAAMAARALGVSDPAVTAALLQMRKANRGEFRAAFGAIIESSQKRTRIDAAAERKPAKPAAPPAQLEAAADAAWARVMSGRVAPQGAGAAPYTSTEFDNEGDDANPLAGVGEEHLKIMRENPDMSPTVALDRATKNVQMRRQRA